MNPTNLSPAAELTLGIAGMHCAGCATRLEKILNALPGVASASVNFAAKSATLTLAAPLPAATLRQAVENAGFSVSGDDLTPRSPA